MFYSPRIRTRQLAQLCRRAGTALHAGVDVRTVFQGEAERGPGRQRSVLREVRDRVAQGDSLTDALQDGDGFFPPLMLAMAEVGEATGKLPEVCLRLADHYDHRLALRRSFLAGITWPVIQLVIALCVVGLLIWVMGIIGNYRGETIDILGFGLVGTSGLMIYLSIVGGLALVLSLVGWSAARGARWFRPFARLAMSLPILGRALRTIALERCAWSLSMTLDTAMDTRQAVRLALTSTATDFFARHAPQAERDVQGGKDLAAVLRRTGVFPADFLHALEVGEQSGRAAESMAALAGNYEQQARSALGTLAMLAGCAVWAVIFGLIIAVIFRLAFFYIGMINAAASGDFI